MLGQDHGLAATRRAQRQVGEVERVVDEHDLAARGPLARELGIAAVALRAARAAAAVGPHRQLAPDGLVRHEGELIAIALARADQPLVEAHQLVLVLRRHPLLRKRPLEPTDVVGAALDDRRGDVQTCRLPGQREVLVEQLPLQRLGGGGHHDASTAERRRHEVGEALADARRSLRHEQAATVDRVADLLREPQLAVPRAERRQRVLKRRGVPQLVLVTAHLGQSNLPAGSGVDRGSVGQPLRRSGAAAAGLLRRPRAHERPATVRTMTVTRIALGVLRSPAGVVWIERAKPPSLGRWALPGGRIEPGEEPLEAARREVLEETELVVTGGLHLAVLEEHFEDAAGRHLYTVEVHAVLFDDPGDAPVAADGVSATHRGPSPPSPALEPDIRLAALPPGAAPHRITARIRADGDDLVVLSWD